MYCVVCSRNHVTNKYIAKVRTNPGSKFVESSSIHIFSTGKLRLHTDMILVILGLPHKFSNFRVVIALLTGA